MENQIAMEEFSQQIYVKIGTERVPCTTKFVAQEFGSKGVAMILEALKYEALENIKKEYGALPIRLMGNPTREERDTWERQRDWAVRHLKNSDAETEALLIGLLTQSERENLGASAATVMAKKILAKAKTAEALISVVGGARREAEKAVESAATRKQVAAAMSSARAKAAQMLTQSVEALV